MFNSKVTIDIIMNNDNHQNVIILHGIARSGKHMKNLAKYLANNNYNIFNITYPSTKYNLIELGDIVNNEIQKLELKNKKTNFIGYSMGGLLTRILINKYQYENLNKVVLLAPPNKGSEVADFLKDFWLYKKIYGPAGQQLITNQEQIKNLFGKIDYDLGIIAGNLSIDPFCSLILPSKNDGKVTIKNTKIKGMKDHIVVKAAHTFFPTSKEVQRQTLNFLKNSEFKH